MLSRQSTGHKTVREITMSILVTMVRGYLLANCGYDSYSREFLIRDADRIVKKVRDTFGRFDERDQGRCATIIRAVMEKSVAPTVQPKRDPEAEREARDKKMVADYLARKERDERLKRAFCI
jgi:hypothetical protein